MRLATCAALVLIAGSPTVAIAQPTRGTVLIGAAGLAAVEKAPTSGGLGMSGEGRGGTVAGGALSVGVHLTERVSARFEWSLTDALKQSQGLSAYSSGSLLGVLAGGAMGFTTGFTTSFPTTPSVSFGPQSVETQRTTAAGFALLGYHLGAGRTSLELLGGVGLLNQNVTTSYVYDRRMLGSPGGFNLPFPTVNDDKTSSYHAVAVLGADLAVTLVGHAAIVPQVRAYALNGGLSIRPGIGLRWTF